MTNKITYDCLILGIDPIISLLIAINLSKKNQKICIINRSGNLLGFEKGFRNPRFLKQISQAFGIDNLQYLNRKDFINIIISKISNIENIDYYGCDYRVHDYGNDASSNFFLIDPSNKKPKSTDDTEIYKHISRKDSKLVGYFPRKLKTKSIEAKLTIIHHWPEFMTGWDSYIDKNEEIFITKRPNIKTLFSGSSLLVMPKNIDDITSKFERELTEAIVFFEKL